MKKTKKIKEIKLPMKFNPGTQKYEPTLPLRRTSEKFNVKINLKDIIIVIATIILITTFIILLSNSYT